jgi:hypothetical protein
MTGREFLFTRKSPERYFRHAAFCLTRLFLLGTQNFIIHFDFSTTFLIGYLTSLHEIYFLVLTELIFTYFTAYYLVPRYLKARRYFSFSAFTLLSLLIVFIVDQIFLDQLTFSRYDHFIKILQSTGDFRLKGPPMVAFLFLALKLFIDWTQKEEKSNQLLKAQIEAEMQSLKANVQPHFLFNTLNNIYSLTLQRSPNAAVLLNKLNSMIHYMANDCSAAWVPLQKEISLIQDYTSLENFRYGSRLHIEQIIEGNSDNQLIPPLLLIPFIENCFKHGTSEVLFNPWIILKITIKQGKLYMDVSNSRPQVQEKTNRYSGLGLKNVQRRLALIYPKGYHLDISNTEDSYSVKLEIGLKSSTDQPILLNQFLPEYGIT